MKKRILSFLLALVLIATIPVIVTPITHAAEVLETGKAGPNITWTTYSDGRLVFSGWGKMEDGKNWLVKNWYRHDPVHVIFEEGITYIGAYSFYSDAAFDSVKTITIPTTLTSIGGYAFCGVENLERVNISNLQKWCSMTYDNYAYPMDMGADLYLNGVKIVDLVIPNNITTLCKGAFWGCESLRSVTIPAHVKTIDNNAFSYCKNLEKIYFKGNAPTFGTKVFYGCNTNAYYPLNNSTWNESVFSLNPEGVTWLWDNQSLFTDVSTSSWYFESVNWAVNKGITNGVSATSFAPDSNCTRAHIITFLWRAAGSPESIVPVSPFDDVKESDYFYQAVLWAVELGITRGVSETAFAPNSECTRAQIVTFLHRSLGSPGPTKNHTPFVDISSEEYYYDAVLWAVEKGITQGMTATTFAPNSVCTRAQAVCFLHRRNLYT